MTGAGKGVDFVDLNDGALLVRISTNLAMQNFAWTGANYKDLWMAGNSEVARVEMGPDWARAGVDCMEGPRYSESSHTNRRK